MPFEPVSARSAKIRCTLCGRTGYPHDPPYPWQAMCMRPHTKVCSCGRTFVTEQQRSLHQRRQDGDHHTP